MDEAAADAERARLIDGELPNLNEEAEEACHSDRGRSFTPLGAQRCWRTAPCRWAESLYLTSERLVHVGQERHEVPLEKIAETAVALERLLLLDLNDGSDLAIEVDQPRLLRVQLAAARANARRQTP